MTRSMIMLGICALLGCGGAQPSSDGESHFSITSVQLENGHETAQTIYVTASEYQKMFGVAAAQPSVRASDGVGVAEQAIQRDNPCTGSSLVLHDETIYVSEVYGSNVICFSGSGDVNLGNYCRVFSGLFCASWWDGRVRSFVPNGHTGGVYLYGNCSQNFNWSDPWTNTNTCGSAADSVYLTY